MNSPVIGSVLRSLSNLQATLVRVDRLAALQRIYAAAVPSGLAEKSTVALERSGVLLVVAETSAVGHKLRQLAPRIVEEIVKSAPEVTSIQVEVQVTLRNDPHGTERPTIGALGLCSLRAFRDRLPSSPLREAVDQLVRRGTQSDRKDQALDHEKRDYDQRQD